MASSLQPRLFLSLWILSICLLSGYCHVPPSHGQHPPSHGQSPPSHGQPPPSHGRGPPSHGQGPPSHLQHGPPHHLRGSQQPPSLMTLANDVSSVMRRFESFENYVQGELSGLKMQLGSCCSGGFNKLRPVDLQITKTRVELNPAGDMATYIIEYNAIQQPRVIWRVESEPAFVRYAKGKRGQPSAVPHPIAGAVMDEGIMTKSFHNGKGKTTLRIDSTKEIVASCIVNHVTFVISFRANPNKTAEMTLRPTEFFVDAGGSGSFHYQKGKPLQILVSSPKFFPGFKTVTDYPWRFWMANDTADPPRMEEYPQWREMNGGTVRIGPIKTLRRIQHPRDLKIVYELMTDKGDYDGILIFSKYLTAKDKSSVITGLTEMRYVFVSRKDRIDPFPDGFIAFVRRDPAVKPCTFNKTCSISCHAVGVVPEAIDLFKIQRDNSLVQLNLPVLQVREPYMLYAHFAIKHMVEEDEGDYICSAYSRLRRSDIRTTILMSEKVEIDNTTSGLRYGPGPDTATITCSARGRPLPKIRLFENYVDQWKNEIVQSNNAYTISRSVQRTRTGDYIAMATIEIRLLNAAHMWRCICIAENQFDLKATDFEMKKRPPPLWGHQHSPQNPQYGPGQNRPFGPRQAGK